MLVTVAEVTVSCTGALLTPPNEAVTLAVPGPTPNVEPLLTVATEGALETHDALEETSWVGVGGVVLLKVAVAVNFCK